MGYTMDTAPFKMSKASKMSAKVRKMLDCTFWDETLALASAMVLACQQNQDETKTKIMFYLGCFKLSLEEQISSYEIMATDDSS